MKLIVSIVLAGWIFFGLIAVAAAWMMGFDPTRVQDTTMLRVEAGPFTMGSDEGEDDEAPAHVVHLDAFEIDRTPITTTQFADFLNAVGLQNAAGHELFDLDDRDARVHLVGDRYLPMPGFEFHPAVEVSWYGARDYCAWRGARLPTEAEWEKAARGTDARPYPWGTQEPTLGLARFGVARHDYWPVGSLPAGASPYGVLDMAGNVSQWVSSLYKPYPYRPDDGREDLTVEGVRVNRGGAHHDSASRLRSAFRGHGSASSAASGNSSTGFRCARGSS